MDSGTLWADGPLVCEICKPQGILSDLRYSELVKGKGTLTMMKMVRRNTWQNVLVVWSMNCLYRTRNLWAYFAPLLLLQISPCYFYIPGTALLLYMKYENNTENSFLHLFVGQVVPDWVINTSELDRNFLRYFHILCCISHTIYVIDAGNSVFDHKSGEVERPLRALFIA